MKGWDYKHISDYLRFVRTSREAFSRGYKEVKVSWHTTYSEQEFNRQFTLALHRRINLKGGLSEQGRKYDADYQTGLMRDARRLEDIRRRVRVYQFETPQLRQRFSHLLARYDD